jgi:hypothetical protein
MPVFIDEETGLPGFSYDLPPEDPANPDTVPVADFSTPPRDPENEIEHEGVVALVDGKTAVRGEDGKIYAVDPDIPDPDKPQPPIEEPEGDPDDNDQPSGNPEDEPDENPPAG